MFEVSLPSLESIYIDSSTAADYLPDSYATCWFLFLVLLVRFLNVFSYAEVPEITLNESVKKKDDGLILKKVLAKCPILKERLVIKY
jgi:hypothetical protein